jgi:hypothetical protein
MALVIYLLLRQRNTSPARAIRQDFAESKDAAAINSGTKGEKEDDCDCVISNWYGNPLFMKVMSVYSILSFHPTHPLLQQ